MEIDLFVTPGLGDNSYLVTSGGEGAVIDPQRDVSAVIQTAAARGARIRYVVETHVHNDYVSGALELRDAIGAKIVGPARAGYAFPHRQLEEGDVVEIGDASLTALEAPGHTFEHTAYLLRPPAADAPSALFSGGSLIVGSAGRTDLLGAERTPELTRLQYRTMRRLSELPDDVALLPTHGAGSFCATSPPGEQRTSSLGAERLANPALTEDSESRFVVQQLEGLSQYPRYYEHMAPINREGPVVFGEIPLPAPMSAEAVTSLVGGGARLVDTRDGASFASAHVPGSLNVPLEESFASYVGWLVPFGDPIALLARDHAAILEASTQLFRIGYERIAGHLDGGIDGWRSAGRELASFPTISVVELLAELERGDAGDVIDVRQRSEWDAGHLDATRHVFVGDLGDRLDEFAGRSVTTVVCASGYRSAMAASLLDRAGDPVRLVATAGVPRALKLLRRAG